MLVVPVGQRCSCGGWLSDNPCPDNGVLSYALALALQDNLFEWHFTIRGPPDTEFEGGMYHGRILLPTEYPFSPPSIVLLTPNGRFETKMKVCLSISAYHPETWLPAWGSTLTSECLLTGERRRCRCGDALSRSLARLAVGVPGWLCETESRSWWPPCRLCRGSWLLDTV